jgi:RNA polymerase sigma-70 factor (ECF subfamily)
MRLIPFKKRQAQKPEQELLGQYRKNHDPEIAGELFGRYMHLVYGVCLKYFKDAGRAKDEVMQLYEKVQEEIKTKAIDNFKNWLYVVAKNHCLMELRKASYGKQVLTGDEELLESFMENEEELHPLDREGETNHEEKLEPCLETLKDEQKQCITMFYFENRSYRQISEETGLEEKKVKSHIQNGKRNLKICLES